MDLMKTILGIEAAAASMKKESLRNKRGSKGWEQTSADLSLDAENGDNAADSTVNIASTLADSRDAKLRDKIAFVRAIAKRQDIIFCDAVNSKTKEEAWKEVAKEVEDLGLKSFAGKTWMRMRDHDWQYVRRHALARSESSHKPTGKLGELDQLVLEIVNRFNGRLSNDYHVEQMLFDMMSEDTEIAEKNTKTELFTHHPEIKLEPPPKIADASAAASVVSSSLTQLMALPATSLSLTTGTRSDSTTPSCSTLTAKIKSAETCAGLSSSGESNEGVLSQENEQTQPLFDNAIKVSTSPSKSSPVPTKRARPADLIDAAECNNDESVVFLRKKRELELRRMELENEKLEKEIQSLINREKRAKELHNIELRRLRLQMVMMGADLLQEPQREE